MCCRFCGSSNLQDLHKIITNTKENQFKPEVSYATITASTGSMTRKKESYSNYDTKFCIICRNVDAADPQNFTPPLEIHLSDYGRMVIIPYLLCTHLKSIQYDASEISKLIRYIKICLEKIYNKWSIDGVNPCKCKHIGRKITIPLKNKIKILCWVIVDPVESKMCLRISYGGNKITCPEN